MAKRRKAARSTPRKRVAKPALAREANPATAEPTSVAPAPPRPQPFAGNSRSRVGQTLRLDPETWLALKMLAAELAVTRGRPVSAHELIVEVVTDMIARRAQRE